MTPGAIADFHEVLAPLWHMPEGPDRVEKTCAAVPAMQDRAKAITTTARPAWASHAQALATAVDALGTECAGTRAEFQTRFTAVHDAFHAVMEAAR